MMRIRLKPQAGLSLIELMIAIVLGLLIVAAMTTIFVNNNATRAEIEKSGRQIANGTYAIQTLNQDLQAAGYLGEYVPATSPTLPTALPDPCATDVATMTSAMILHVQGYDDSTGSLSCISDVAANTDVLVVRRVATCTAANPADSNCDALAAGTPYLQVSGCSTDPASYKLDTNTGNLTLKKVGCANTASIRRFLTHIYFIANNDRTGDGIPTLKRWELGTGIVPIAEGIENLQVEYGIDSSGDGIPDTFTSAPSTVTDWWNAMTVKVGILARNDSTSAGYTDTKSYVLAGTSVTPSATGYRRQVYNAAVKLANPAGRREQ